MRQAQRLGRQLGTGIFALIVAAFTVVCSVQICLQVWSPDVVPLSTDCATGTLMLAESLEAAREAAARERNERAALAAFRQALAPAWDLRPALRRKCAGDAVALRRLKAVDRLRYAEEHAVRYGAVDLAERRREVTRLLSPLRPTAWRGAWKAAAAQYSPRAHSPDGPVPPLHQERRVSPARSLPSIREVETQPWP